MRCIINVRSRTLVGRPRRTILQRAKFRAAALPATDRSRRTPGDISLFDSAALCSSNVTVALAARAVRSAIPKAGPDHDLNSQSRAFHSRASRGELGDTCPKAWPFSGASMPANRTRYCVRTQVQQRDGISILDPNYLERGATPPCQLRRQIPARRPLWLGG